RDTCTCAPTTIDGRCPPGISPNYPPLLRPPGRCKSATADFSFTASRGTGSRGRPNGIVCRSNCRRSSTADFSSLRFQFFENDFAYSRQNPGELRRDRHLRRLPDFRGGEGIEPGLAEIETALRIDPREVPLFDFEHADRKRLRRLAIQKSEYQPAT